MKSYDEYIEEITESIEISKQKNRKSIYLISAEMTNNIANGIKSYFEVLDYDVETKRCAVCQNVFDIIINWK